MLKTDEEKWPRDQMISKGEWMKRMKEDPKFYWYTQMHNPKEMTEKEKLLLFLCAIALKRQIVVIPFLEDGSPMKFGEEFKHQTFLMGCNNLQYENFFISIFQRKRKLSTII